MAIFPAATCSLRSMNQCVVIELLLWLLICYVLIELLCGYGTNKNKKKNKMKLRTLKSRNLMPFLPCLVVKIVKLSTNKTQEFLAGQVTFRGHLPKTQRSRKAIFSLNHSITQTSTGLRQAKCDSYLAKGQA